MRDPALRPLLGMSYLFPASTDEWVGGVVLSSPVLDVTCHTPSFATGCYNFSDPTAHLPSGSGAPRGRTDHHAAGQTRSDGHAA